MNDDLLFLDTDDTDETEQLMPSDDDWKILIIDDEPEVHKITKLALVNFNFENRPVTFLHAYSAQEAMTVIEANPDIAVALLDVVMETNHAGLDLVQKIRVELGNHSIRIVLRTGQPGVAPERSIILNYDINDYVDKTELSAQKLYTLVIASLRAYRDIIKLENSRKDLQLANQRLIQQAQRIQVTLDSIGDAVLTTDAKGVLTHLNPVAEVLTGWSLKEARGQPLSDIFKIINAQSRQVVDNPVLNVLATGNIIGLASHTLLINKQGDEYQIADSAAPIHNEAGEIVGVILVCRDITQEQQLEQALQRSQKMDALGQLTGGIAHDFNNQLGIIIGYLDILQEHYAEEKKANEWVGICCAATLRCMDLTRQLLSFTRTQSIETTLVDINAGLKELQTMYVRSVTPAVEVQYSLSQDLWLTEINQGEFQDATLNLVINARDAMPEGGTLLIETLNKSLDEAYVAANPGSRAGEFVQIMFSDSGCGMSKQTQQKIFEPFFTTKPKGKGTGLGMSMVYGFAKRFDGFVNIYSELNVGTVIRLYLPRSSNTELAVDSQTTGEENLPTGSETILIVDDESGLLQLAEVYLNELGYKTYVAENAQQALKIFSEHSDIDCLFSDVVMPGGMNGYELAASLTQLKPQLKVLLSSGFTSKSIVKDGGNAFNKAILNKPYRKSELAKRIRQLLDED